MVWVPANRAALEQAALRALPEPISATALQPPIVAPLSVKVIVPLGALPVTVAVKVTFVPTVDGLLELASAVAVALAMAAVPANLPAWSNVARPSYSVNAIP